VLFVIRTASRVVARLNDKFRVKGRFGIFYAINACRSAFGRVVIVMAGRSYRRLLMAKQGRKSGAAARSNSVVEAKRDRAKLTQPVPLTE